MRGTPAGDTALDPVPGGIPVGVAGTSLGEQVFETLREWIITGHLPPGYALRIRELAQMVGTSVMPVRLAVRRLVESGLAVQEPYKGATVRGLGLGELDHAYDVRMLLEPHSAYLGASTAPEHLADQMTALITQLHQAVRAGDARGALHLDEQTLCLLYRAGGNQIMTNVIRGLWDQCQPYKLVWARDATERQDLRQWQYLTDLVDAVGMGDASRAEQILQASLAQAKTSIRQSLLALTQAG